ncbi:MAG: acetyl-CoA carboxylase carboxyltransferase subunit alpha [candidate division KSB1 bacterium]|jgi:acetyl-CoA carboxylase carboxyl transferase subunit alpha|nr:acetyl-CoA carboxylase carboxyltransferase subunit alpha [candidate division KSB1 bacterium]
MEKITLDFEKPIVELEKKIKEMKDLSLNGEMKLNDDIKRLEDKAIKLRKDIFSKLTRWQKVQLARHPQRPYTLDYLERITDYFIELHGDRAYGDDPAIVCGLSKIDSMPVAIVGHQKGRTTKQKLYRNFGMPHPEGYRKALRVMRLAAKFNRPIICLIDTPGAYPGIGAEERGQAEAIAKNLFEMSHLPVPILIIVIGEGASGGALGIGVGDRIFMMQNTWYSVISPEGCAAILWRDSARAEQAAEAMKVTSDDLVDMKVADGIIKEPDGGAHRDYDAAAAALKAKILSELNKLHALPKEELIRRRIEKFGKMGCWNE